MRLSLSPSLRRDGLLLVGVLLTAALITLVRLQSSVHPAEDAAMLMRYSAHLAQGHGVVWNIGEKPVDGATDFLFMVLLAGLNALGIRLEGAVLGVGVTAHLLTVLLVYWTVARFEPGSCWLGVFAGLVLAIGPGPAYTAAYFGTTTFAFSGALTWHLAARLARAGEPTRVQTLSFAAACLLTGLIRPEGVFLALFILLGLLVRREGRGARAILRDIGLIFGGLGLAYFIWRWAYFGYPLPNPFYKKGGGGLHPTVLLQSFRELIQLNQPFIWLLGGTLIALLVKWLPSLSRASFSISLNIAKIRRALLALTVLSGLAVGLGFLRRSQPQAGMIFERYSQQYFTLLMVGVGGVLVLGLAALTAHRWLPVRLRLPWFASRLSGEVRAWALRAGFLLIPVLGFTLIWILLSNEMNYLGRFQYPLTPLILMGAPPLLSKPLGWWRQLSRPPKLILLFLVDLGIVVGLGFMLMLSAVQNYPDGRYDVAQYLRQYAGKGYTIATSEAGLLPFYSTWRAVDTWGLNDQWITHTGEVTEAYLDRYHPEVIVFHANLKFTETAPQTAWDWMARRLWNYARARGYTLAAAFGSEKDDYHYYYVRTDFADAPAIIEHLRQMDYPWYVNGKIAVNHALTQP